jgi:hypothetical protein
MSSKSIENGDGKKPTITETEKGKSYRSSLPASFWEKRNKNLKEIDDALDPKKNTLPLDPQYKESLLKMRDEESRKGYTDEELSERVSNASKQQLEREESKKAESKGVQDSFNQNKASKIKSMKK